MAFLSLNPTWNKLRKSHRNLDTYGARLLNLEKQINRNLTVLMKEIQLIEGQSIDSATLLEDFIYNTIETWWALPKDPIFTFIFNNAEVMNVHDKQKWANSQKTNLNGRNRSSGWDVVHIRRCKCYCHLNLRSLGFIWPFSFAVKIVPRVYGLFQRI